MVNLPTDFLRSFVAIVKNGSILKASEQIGLTPSALSLQIKRLEETLQAPLFHRGGRHFVPTPIGLALLECSQKILELNDRAVSELLGNQFAGPVRVGLVQDFADTFLSGVLGSFVRSNSAARLDIRVAGSAELLSLLNADRLDIVACLSEQNVTGAVGSSPLFWYGNSSLELESVLPVALMEKPCIFRDLIIQTLERVKRPYRIALETSSVSGLRAAVEGGIALTCRTAGFGSTLLDQSALTGSPMPPVYKVLVQRSSQQAIVNRLADLLRASMLELTD